jgi:hypothetical protein
LTSILLSSYPPLEIPDQQEAEVAARRQSWPPVAGVESLAQAFDVSIEVVFVEELIQSCVEGMGGAARQVWDGEPHRHLSRPPSSFAHRHR